MPERLNGHPVLEHVTRAERRLTALEWITGHHDKRLLLLEEDAKTVRDTLLKLFRGIAAVSVTYALDHALSGGAFLRALAGLFVH